jgi:uncharacterized protein (TIGR01244 family)
MKKVTDKLWISPQPTLADLEAAHNAGIKRIVNNRPDDEEPGQMSATTAAAKAAELGMDYVHIPIVPGQITPEKVRSFQQALAEAPGPVLAHCKSGTRSLTLWTIGEVLDGRLAIDEIDDLARRMGVDLAGARNWLRASATTVAAPQVTGFYEKRTGSIQYVVADPATSKCAIIDPVLDFDEKSGATATRSADSILEFVEANGLRVQWILDTHPHADHFSAAHYLKSKTGAPTAIGEKVVEVQKLWKDIYNWPDFPSDGSQWDKLFAHGESFSVGSIPAKVMLSPGHTLASVTYVIGDTAFVHDTLFMPDSGTARADFPGGSASRLWKSIQDILALPDTTRVFTGHDYRPDGREARWESTVAEQRATNSHISKCRTEAEYVALREARDKTLPMPKLILHALQVNINGGRLPDAEANGKRYLKFPLDALGGAAWE